jgi:tetratricopeptide (TPR) repeat protein
LLAKGDALDAKLQNKQALEIYQLAEKQEPKNVEVICRISRQYGLLMVDAASKEECKAMAEKALARANQACALDPRNATAQLSVAVCYGRIAPMLDTKTKVAYSKLVKEHADKALELDPTNDLTYFVLGAWNYEVASLGAFTKAMVKLIYGEIPPASYEKAREDFEKSLKLNPKRLATHVELGRTLAALGQKAEARKELTAALQIPNREKDDPTEKSKATQALKDL